MAVHNKLLLTLLLTLLTTPSSLYIRSTENNQRINIIDISDSDSESNVDSNNDNSQQPHTEHDLTEVIQALRQERNQPINPNDNELRGLRHSRNLQHQQNIANRPNQDITRLTQADYDRLAPQITSTSNFQNAQLKTFIITVLCSLILQNLLNAIINHYQTVDTDQEYNDENIEDIILNDEGQETQTE